ncbi:uncharacterized protein LOC128732545 [Sabethes cyaneus]|uniref:uncharacterized protein LOC128732545 n=1 Tax=Sabethes cyaneus TaxID=53552 RepID=UPI00237E6384|nr:uncharacterized protein LOC128732545 [Sabethes cyaneus]
MSGCSWKNRLKLAQVIIGINLVGLEVFRIVYRVRPCLPTDFHLAFVTFSATFVTVVRLVNAVKENHPIEKAFGRDLWFRLQLRSAGIAALALYCSSWTSLLTVFGLFLHPQLLIVSTVFGFVLTTLYLIDWWQLFRKRPSAIAETGDAESATEQTDNVKGSFLAS